MLYLHSLLLFLLIGTELFFIYLEARNLNHSEQKARHKSDWLKEAFEVDDLDQLLSYNRLNSGFSRLKGGIFLLFSLLVLYSGLFAQMVDLVENHIPYRPFELSLAGVVFFAGLSMLFILLGAPFSAFKTFVIEEIFDFNTNTVGLWFKDLLKSLLLTALIVSLLSAALLYFVELLPQLWWLAGWGLVVGFGLLMQIIYPRLIAPLFNKFERVEEGELRDAVEEVFERAGFECSQIYTMDASRRSSHSNAYFVGFGRTKRVVLFDTLVEQMSLSQVQAVLAHELAHWKKGHIWKRILLGAAKNFVVFLILFYLLESRWLYEMFAVEVVPYAGFLLAGLWLSPIGHWLSPLTNYFSTSDEKEADRFARDVLEDPEPMIGALCKLGGENLANPFPDPLYAAFHYSHPPIPERIRLLKNQDSNLEEAESLEEEKVSVD